MEKNETMNKMQDDNLQSDSIKDEGGLTSAEKKLCNYMIQNALDDDDTAEDLLKKMQVYYNEYSKLAYKKPKEVLSYFKNYLGDKAFKECDEKECKEPITEETKESEDFAKSVELLFTAVEDALRQGKSIDDILKAMKSVKKDESKKVNESQSQEIGDAYKRLSKLYGVDFEDLVYGKDGFMNSVYPDDFPDFAGDVIYSEKYWNEFEKWLKDNKGIDLDKIRKEHDFKEKAERLGFHLIDESKEKCDDKLKEEHGKDCDCPKCKKERLQHRKNESLNNANKKKAIVKRRVNESLNDDLDVEPIWNDIICK